MCIGFDAILNVAEQFVEFFGDGSGLTVLRNDVALLVFQIVDTTDGADYGSRSASTGFLEGFEFFFGNGANLYFLAKVFGQLLQTAVGD